METETNEQEFKFGAPDNYGDFPYLYAGKWNKDNLNEILKERLPDSYPMQLVDQTEIDVLAAVVNIGIDAHLESATLTMEPHAVPMMAGETCMGHKYGIGFDKKGMICLIRRLMEFDANAHFDFTDCEPSEDNPDESQEERDTWEAAYSLVGSILETLQIEYMG